MVESENCKMDPDIKMRPIMKGDNAVIAHIIRTTLEEFGANHPGTVYFDESTDRLSTLFTIAGSCYFVVHQNDIILGGGGIYPTVGLDKGICELVKMYLLPAARGKGLGAALLKKCMDFARSNGYKQIYLETMPELSLALELYRKTGFRKLDTPIGQSGHFGCDISMILDLE